MTSAVEGYMHLPRFPDGRIDYTGHASAPIILCVISFDGKVLIVKRSNKVGDYKNKWNIVTGYIDNPKISVKEHAILEMHEEIGLNKKDIAKMEIMEPYDLYDRHLKKSYKVFAAIVHLKHMPVIKLNEENSEFAWVDPKDLNKYDSVSDLKKTLAKHVI
jgi:8-oxo-dGTP diphosphatase